MSTSDTVGETFLILACYFDLSTLSKFNVTMTIVFEMIGRGQIHYCLGIQGVDFNSKGSCSEIV
jgi:hypothetical protein